MNIQKIVIKLQLNLFWAQPLRKWEDTQTINTWYLFNFFSDHGMLACPFDKSILMFLINTYKMLHLNLHIIRRAFIP